MIFLLLNLISSSAQINYNSPHTLPIYGNISLGYYYANFYFGTPPQKQSLLLDTGSSLMAFTCSDCTESSCGTHMNEHFQIKQSSSIQKLGCSQCNPNQCKNGQCSFSQKYVEGSIIEGEIYYDNFSIYENDEKQIPINFGWKQKYFKVKKLMEFWDLELKVYKYYLDQLTYDSMVTQLFKYHNDKDTLGFSLCIGENGGYMTLGGYNDAYHDINNTVQKIQYTDKFQQYSIKLNEIIVGETYLDSINKSCFDQGQGVFLDSGATFSHFPYEIYQKILDQLIKNLSDQILKRQKDSVCFYLYNEDEIKQFPNIKFQLEQDQIIEWEPKTYLYQDLSELNLFCIGIKTIGQNVILGGSFMQGKDIYFDKSNKQIYFTKSDCRFDKSIPPKQFNFVQLTRVQKLRNLNHTILYSPIIFFISLIVLFKVLVKAYRIYEERQQQHIEMENIDNQETQLNQETIQDNQENQDYESLQQTSQEYEQLNKATPDQFDI